MITLVSRLREHSLPLEGVDHCSGNVAKCIDKYLYMLNPPRIHTDEHGLKDLQPVMHGDGAPRVPRMGPPEAASGLAGREPGAKSS